MLASEPTSMHSRTMFGARGGISLVMIFQRISPLRVSAFGVVRRSVSVWKLYR